MTVELLSPSSLSGGEGETVETTSLAGSLTSLTGGFAATEPALSPTDDDATIEAGPMIDGGEFGGGNQDNSGILLGDGSLGFPGVSNPFGVTSPMPATDSSDGGDGVLAIPLPGAGLMALVGLAFIGAGSRNRRFQA